MKFSFLLLIHLISSSVMTGVIWVIQLVHYPSFSFLAKKKPTEQTVFHRFHSTRISMIVVPVMFVELGSAFLLVLDRGIFSGGWQILNLGFVLAIWAVTFFVQAPQHSALAKNFTQSAIRKLVHYNWMRTVLWTLHLILASVGTSYFS